MPSSATALFADSGREEITKKKKKKEKEEEAWWEVGNCGIAHEMLMYME